MERRSSGKWRWPCDFGRERKPGFFHGCFGLVFSLWLYGFLFCGFLVGFSLFLLTSGEF